MNDFEHLESLLENRGGTLGETQKRQLQRLDFFSSELEKLKVGADEGTLERIGALKLRIYNMKANIQDPVDGAGGSDAAVDESDFDRLEVECESLIRKLRNSNDTATLQ